MNRPKPLLIALLIVVVGWFTFSQSISNSYDGPIFSNSRKEAIASGYFSADYIPTKLYIQLKNDSALAPSVWTEDARETRHSNVFFETVQDVFGSYNLIVDSLRRCDTASYNLDFAIQVRALNCIPKLGYIYLIDEEPDSMWFTVKQGSDEEGWANPILVDSILYIKKKKGSSD